MAESVKPEHAWTQFAMSVFKINGLIIQAGEGITGPIGQSSARWQVLGRAYQPQTVSNMARDIGHARQSVQRIADVLEEEGLIAYLDNPSDRRARLAQLTPEGVEVLNAIYLRQVEWSLQIMKHLNAAQLVDIADALGNVSRVLATAFEASKAAG